MFFISGSAIPYLVYFLCIWGIFLLNTCLNVVYEKDDSSPEKIVRGYTASDYINAKTIFYPVAEDHISDTEQIKNYFSVFSSYILRIPELKPKPGVKNLLPENKLLRSPPLYG
jgi:hypothetical protein